MITDAGFKVLTVVTNKNIIFLDVTLCNLVEIYEHIRGTYRLQDRRVSRASHAACTAYCLLLACCLFSLPSNTEDGGHIFH